MLGFRGFGKKTSGARKQSDAPENPRVARLTGSLQPSSVLFDLAAVRHAYEKHFHDGRIVAEIYLDRTGSMPSPADVSELNAKREELRKLCEADPAFKAAAKRLESAGVGVEFGGQGDYCGEFNVLRLRGSVKSLAAVEALAADDAGYRTRAERASAAERFRIFLHRNYDPDWEANRRRYPDVGGSPYANPPTCPCST